VIRIGLVEPDDETWRDWCDRAKQATEDLVAGRASKINEDLYKEKRDFIFRMFHGKCAYCELPLAEGQRYGDLDHYRPKGRVTDKDGKLVFVSGKQHPGYFWLAYHWTNLLPSCLGCNRPGTAPDGTKSGKWDKFPVADGFYVTAFNEDLRREQPTLLNPYLDNPDEHLSFDPDTGTVGAKTTRGQDTIDILGLNRDALIEARMRTARAALRAFSDYTAAVIRRDVRADLYQPEVNEFEKGIAPFSAAARAVIGRGKEELMLRLFALPNRN